MIRPDVPVAGFYAMRLARAGIEVAVRIWFGPPVVDGEELDRSPRWCAEVDGRTDKTVDGCRVPIDPLDDDVWPFCTARTIDQAEFDFLTRRAAWARRYAASHPAARPRRAIDLRSLPPLF